MKWTLVAMLVLAGCGYSSRNNDLIGQVKKVKNVTPIICPDRNDVDISLGVMRNGVGSMSSEDIWATVNDVSVLKILKEANETGAIVKAVYNVHRFQWCQVNLEIVSAEITK